MSINTTLHTDHQLDQLAAQFEHWRQNRSHRSERIPQTLWEQAAALAKELPYSRVARNQFDRFEAFEKLFCLLFYRFQTGTDRFKVLAGQLSHDVRHPL